MKDPLVTVLINNYNYALYVAASIESALQQSYRPLEVVVVDDGSLDESRTVISSYGGAVVAVFKQNGGQASAFNAGFGRSRGEIVTFLDADDILLDDVVERVVEAFSSRSSIGMVQCRLELADETGTPLGVFIPPAYVRMPTCDLRSRPADLNNASWWAPTSGISVASSVLNRVLPLPEDIYPISADIGLALASALCAPVMSLEMIGGYYRSHGRNYYNRGQVDSDRVRSDVRRHIERQRHLRRFSEDVEVEGYPHDPYAMLDTIFLIQRMLLLKLAPPDERLQRDTLLTVGWRGLMAAVRRPDVGPMIKALLVCWFGLMVVLPRPLAARLANKTLFQQNRRRSSRLMARAWAMWPGR
jgi:glycosyltransferase involved in cell wall biosynthesis